MATKKPETSEEQFLALAERFVVAIERYSKAFELWAAKKGAGPTASRPADPNKVGEEYKSVEGVVSQISEKGEWIQAEVTKDNGHVLWLSTKDSDKQMPLISANRTGQPVKIEYVERPSSDPTKYKYPNRYVRSITVIGTAPTDVRVSEEEMGF